MSSMLLSVSVSLLFSAPPAQLPPSATSPIARALQGEQIIAQMYGDEDPHGNDPHGGNPHNENHEYYLPANKADYGRQATGDVYGGQEPGGVNSQHPLDNLPGQPRF
ncbi:MAG TPA: hypothetical protein V6C89_15555 [Drouetiella sp.]